MNKYEKNHRALWNWLAITGDTNKWNSIQTLGLSDAIEDCYACEYSEDNGNKFCDNKCAVVWGVSGCCEQGSPYLKWRDAKTPRTRKKYAKIIANLKWINRR